MVGLALTVTAAVAVAVGLYPTTEAMRAPPPALDPPPSSPAAPEATGAAAPSPAAPEATGATAAPSPAAPSPAPPSPARAVAVSDAPTKRRAPRSSPRPSAPAPTGTGRLVLDTHPWTKIYLGGRFLGDTPLNEVAVPAGHLELRAVNVELGIDKLIEVDVAPDRLVRLRREW